MVFIFEKFHNKSKNNGVKYWLANYSHGLTLAHGLCFCCVISFSFLFYHNHAHLRLGYPECFPQPQQNQEVMTESMWPAQPGLMTSLTLNRRSLLTPELDD